MKFARFILPVLALLTILAFAIPAAAQATSVTCGGGNNTLVNATGSALTGITGATVSAWTNVAGCVTLITSIRNKAGSLSNETFMFQEVVCGFTSCANYNLGSTTVSPGQVKYGSISIVPGGINEALNVFVSTASATPSGTDNFHVVVGNATFTV